MQRVVLEEGGAGVGRRGMRVSPVLLLEARPTEDLVSQQGEVHLALELESAASQEFMDLRGTNFQGDAPVADDIIGVAFVVLPQACEEGVVLRWEFCSEEAVLAFALGSPRPTEDVPVLLPQVQLS